MSPVSLASLGKGARGVIFDVRDDAQSLGDEAQSTVSRRLLELGFIAGETVEVISVVWPGGDPMAVRLGNTTIACMEGMSSSTRNWIALSSSGNLEYTCMPYRLSSGHFIV